MKRTAGGPNCVELRHRLVALRAERRAKKTRNRSASRSREILTRDERAEVFTKTAGHCHICGGQIGNERWQADHVLAFSVGGEHRLDNYLPAHALCNNYRWDYLSEEFQLILKLGVFGKTQIERGTAIGRRLGAAFSAHEMKRVRRRKQADLAGLPTE